MSLRNKLALILWTREGKTGIESIKNVPENARFVGAATPVLFSGDKRFYPGKILMISDDMQALEVRADEVALEIIRAKQAQSKVLTRTRRTNKKPTDMSVATDREIAMALGSRPPVPSHLQQVHEASQKAKKDASVHHVLGQNSLDHIVMNSITKNMFLNQGNSRAGPSSASSFDSKYLQGSVGKENVEDSEGYNSAGEGNRNQFDSADSDDDVTHKEDSKPAKWCGCPSCNLLQKYDQPMYHNFLQDLSSLFEDSEDSSSKQFLELKDIPKDVKQVELVRGTGVFIAAADKERLKVDWKNKPSSLLRETLFCLYGKEAFRVLSITGRGNKKGTYAIPNSVQETVCVFVNRNVAAEKALKTTELPQIINRRAREWKKTPSPMEKKKNAGKRPSSDKVISTSPSKILTKVISTAQASSSGTSETSIVQAPGTPETSSAQPSENSSTKVPVGAASPWKAAPFATDTTDSTELSTTASLISSGIHTGSAACPMPFPSSCGPYQNPNSYYHLNEWGSYVANPYGSNFSYPQWGQQNDSQSRN